MANSSAPLPCCHPHQGLLEVALLHHHRLAPLAQQSFQRGPKLAWSLLPLLTSLRDGDLNLEDGVCLWLSVAQLKSLKLVPFSHIAISRICLNLTLISERSSLSFQTDSKTKRQNYEKTIIRTQRASMARKKDEQSKKN